MTVSPTSRPVPWLSVGIPAGLLAGTLDGIAGAALYYSATGRNPLGVFPYIASGVFGPAAFGGGWPMMVWGVFFHYLIALSFALFFVWIASRVPWLRRHWVLAGLLYGVFVWIVMNVGILPVSNVPKGPFNAAQAVLNVIVLMVAVGLPIAWLTRRNGWR